MYAADQSIFKVNLATNKALVEMALLALAITTAVALRRLRKNYSA